MTAASSPFRTAGHTRKVNFMTKEQKCVAELYALLEQIEYGVRHHDLTLLRVPRGATGCDMFQGLPPISRVMADILDRYGDVISKSFDGGES